MERGKWLSKELQEMVDRRREVMAENAKRLKSMGIAGISVDPVRQTKKKVMTNFLNCHVCILFPLCRNLCFHL